MPGAMIFTVLAVFYNIAKVLFVILGLICCIKYLTQDTKPLHRQEDSTVPHP